MKKTRLQLAQTTKTLFGAAFVLLFTTLSTNLTKAAEPNSSPSSQYYEVRTYHLESSEDEQAVDTYLKDALIPAMKRINIGPIGVFSPAANDTIEQLSVVVVIPFGDLNRVSESQQHLKSDQAYLAAAANYLGRGAKESAFKRISSELLVAMDCMSSLKVPDGTLSNPNRVYELRLYESANERLGNLKVDMFNNGEVPIFHDSGITPIFIGQALIGPQTPNLTYLTVYPNDEARLKAWDTFRAHPDWQVLKQVTKYKNTVSKIDKFVLRAKPYSQM